MKAESVFGDSRIDFLLESEREKCLLEVKSCTLVEDGMARFPDAPTLRGRRHLRALVKARQLGLRACVLFVIQRPDASAFAPNQVTDSKFADTLRFASENGVEVYDRKCNLHDFQISLAERVPVRL